MGMEKISETILNKIKVEAQDILKEAEEKARERIEKAREQHEARFREVKNKLIEEAEREAAKVRAQASIVARQELLKIKNEVIDGIVSSVKKYLAISSSGKDASLGLLRETIGATGADKVKVYIAPKDIDNTRNFINEDRELADKITEIKEYNCAGGVIAEDIEGKIRIDNSYETRLETLLPSILPEISKELFKNV